MPKKEWTAEERQHYSDMAKERARKNREAREMAEASNDENEIVAEPEAEYFPPPAIAPGGVPVNEPDGPPEELVDPPPPPSEFDRFLLALDAETREMLDDDELLQIFEEQQLKARAERRVALKKRAADKALATARIDAGVTSPASAAEVAWRERMNEKIWVTIEMPTCGGIPQPGVILGPVDIGLRVDGVIYLDGHRYEMTRAQYESIREIQYRAQQNELGFEGRDRGHYLRRQALGSVEVQASRHIM